MDDRRWIKTLAFCPSSIVYRPSSRMNWFALDVTLEPAAREAVEYALMEAGALGTETKDAAEELLTSGYFERVPERERVRAALFEALRIYGLPSSAVRELRVREVAARDWLAEWKASWQPVAVGARFLIAPPWSEIAETDERHVIRIEPGMAFGTGTHETTRLCLVAIEQHFNGGRDRAPFARARQRNLRALDPVRHSQPASRRDPRASLPTRHQRMRNDGRRRVGRARRLNLSSKFKVQSSRFPVARYVFEL